MVSGGWFGSLGFQNDMLSPLNSLRSSAFRLCFDFHFVFQPGSKSQRLVKGKLLSGLALTVLAFMAFPNSTEAQQHWLNNSGPASPSYSVPIVEGQSSVIEATCDCGSGQCSSCLGRIGAKRSQGTTIQELWHREQPSGNQTLNFPYHTPQLYHYNRPYNTLHIRRARGDNRMETGLGQTVSGQYPAHPYSTEVFDQVHNELSGYHQRPTNLGYLEYSDWRRYEAAQREWELYHPPQQANRDTGGIRATLNSNSLRSSR